MIEVTFDDSICSSCIKNRECLIKDFIYNSLKFFKSEKEDAEMILNIKKCPKLRK